MTPNASIEQIKEEIARKQAELNIMETYESEGTNARKWKRLCETRAASTDFMVEFAKTIFPWAEKIIRQSNRVVVKVYGYNIYIPTNASGTTIDISYDNRSVLKYSPESILKIQEELNKDQKVLFAMKVSKRKARRVLYEGNNNGFVRLINWLHLPNLYKNSEFWESRVKNNHRLLEKTMDEYYDVLNKYNVNLPKFAREILPLVNKFAEDVYAVRFE